MKTTALALVIAAGLATGAAVAEPFNDRGINYIETVQPDPTARFEPAPADVTAFNNRGVNYINTAPAGSNAPGEMARVAVRGFNDRSHVGFSGGLYGDFNSRQENEVRLGNYR